MKRTAKVLMNGLGFSLLALVVAVSVPAQEAPNLLFILDASGSMWGQIDGTAKIVTAKEVLIARINDLPERANVGLMVFGHRTEKDCQDIELTIPLGPKGAARAKARIGPIKPRGKTPISRSIRQAVDVVKTTEGERTIILVSDGKETCEGDPSDVVAELKKAGINFRVHVIGFGVTADERRQLERIAKMGGGEYYSAKTADQFKVSIKKAVAKAVAAPAPPLATGLAAEREPNNSILEPNVLSMGSTMTAAISAKDTDYFKVTSTTPHRDWVHIDLINRSTTLRPGLTLYDEKKSKITYTYNDTNGADITLKLVMVPKQIIYVQTWNRSNTTGKYHLKAMPQKAYDEFEPNDKAFDATKVPLGESVTANIMDKGDTDYYQVRSAKGGGAKTVVLIENGSTTLRPGVTIFNPKKAKMTYKYDDTSGSDLELAFDSKPGEKYYIQVWSRSNTAGTYRLTVEQQ
jgi:Mg-chelatase subunit ChlD